MELGAMNRSQTVAFVCQHASAKSLIAAQYLNRLARDRGLAFSATTSGPEPDPEIPAHVVEGLLRRGIDVRTLRPVLVCPDVLARSDYVVSFGCDMKGLLAAGHPLEQWDNCPAVSDDFDIAWSFITARVEQLLNRLAEANRGWQP
jgi:arsenate reductase (thioredoxin)